MDSYRDYPNDFDLAASETPAADDVAAAIGTDERRMHVRAYNYWVSLLDGRDFPSIEDLEPGDVQDFAPNSVLLDFTCGKENPAVPYIGGAIRDECGLDDGMRTIADVPSRSLLSRLTDHYMQIIANRAPVGFEAEFENQRDESICYRGILMPFSSDGDTIDFIYGVINWKTVGEEYPATAPAEPLELAADDVVPFAEPETEEEAVAIHGIETHDEQPVAEEVAEGPADEAIEPEPELPPLELVVPEHQPIHSAWEDGPLADTESDPLPEIELDDDAGLADRLWAARPATSAWAGDAVPVAIETTI